METEQKKKEGDGKKRNDFRHTDGIGNYPQKAG